MYLRIEIKAKQTNLVTMAGEEDKLDNNGE